MNVFVLSTGRCGSQTFAMACRHITNYSSAHESRIGVLGPGRLDYPDHHIEVDNRLSWFLGRLDEAYGERAFYVHLLRDDEAVARSYAARLWTGSALPAYGRGLLVSRPGEGLFDPLEVARDYVRTVNANIRFFLAGKPRALAVRVENARADFAAFWDAIVAEGDRERALAEWWTAYNSSVARRPLPLLRRLAIKLRRFAFHLPQFVREV